MAKFYGIGTGPGDSDLITVRGKNVLSKLDCLYTPEAKKAGKSLALKIVTPYLPDDLEIKQRHFPMVNHLAEKQAAWDKIAEEIITDVKSGKEVGFITLGDPMIYSTYSYLLERVVGKIATETIAGISSFTQMANALQLPLVIDEESYAVLPATADEAVIKMALEQFSTIVLMKVAVNLPKIINLLQQQDLLKQTVLVSNASMATENIMLGIESLAADEKLSYFTTMIVYKNRKIN
ncbi:precorrin-2/cobalt-factor-2 C20-methyltransferase [Enterococcus sp. PF1-24]|uniref:cobalt-factor II C(20)-methyltransferase n=1 Tax=unclassified Enterococcus TaxID=2608891 RepID=UPI0024736518|nr:MULTISPECIES: cobalt-factor II C(20)-methyltransferase [unclassified Enterococcus]MDH6363377.1 precorrin-2/cobalt-factor-2 C20-methyltransferase [Enterococcus sp. PFB1-1]MDH6400322.1 precorrin-2/cobalt-factor-2 C20-methyltransferase [Enterococcus sp. PF1-24]